MAAAGTTGGRPGSPRVAVVGGGITGLTAAFYLRRWYGIDATILEAEDRLGGNIATLREDGFAVENGPNGFLDSVPETLELARDLGLAPLRSNDGARVRYLASRGRLVRVPTGPLSFLASPLLSFSGRLRVFGEPFAHPPPPGDQTVFDFAERRIGREAAEVLVDAMVKGVFAGDSTALSLRSAFPKMAAMEAEHGSLVRAMMAKMWRRLRGSPDAAPGGPAGPAGTLTSFRTGMEELIEALGKELSASVRLGTEVRELSRSAGGTFVLGTNRGPFEADRVLLAIPAPQAAAVLDRSLPGAAGILRQIPSAPVTVVALAMRSVERPLDGFGFLVPEREGSRILGCLWSSSIFAGRAPAGSALLTAMVGGARDALAADLPDGALTALVLAELRRFMGHLPDPDRTWIFRYPQGISQYPPGHEDRLAALDRLLATMPGLVAAGSSFRGISVNLCVVQARAAARRLGESSCGPP